MKTQLILTFMCTSSFPSHNPSSSRLRHGILAHSAEHNAWTTAGLAKLVRYMRQYVNTMEVSMNRIRYQSKSGTKCFLYKVIQMDLDSENLDPLINHDNSSS